MQVEPVVRWYEGWCADLEGFVCSNGGCFFVGGRMGCGKDSVKECCAVV